MLFIVLIFVFHSQTKWGIHPLSTIINESMTKTGGLLYSEMHVTAEFGTKPQRRIMLLYKEK